MFQNLIIKQTCFTEYNKLRRYDYFFFRRETDWIWSYMRSELKSYSNLIDNKGGINNCISAIDELTTENISMYINIILINLLFSIFN